jgi:hypothetical protein
MANNIVGGLFGVTPYDVASQRVNDEAQLATNFAQLTPQQQGQYGMYAGGAGLVRAASGLLGAEDPAMVQAKQMQQVKQWIAQSGVDINSPEGLAQAAQYAQSIGAIEGAMYLSQQSQQMRKQRTEVGTAEENLQRGQQYRAAVAQLQQNPNATEQDYINLARQFSGPEAGMTAAISAQSRQEMAQQKQDLKEQAALEQQTKAAEMAFGRAGVVLDKAKQAYNMVNARTTGPLGVAMKAMPGSDATDMAGLIETIKSNLATSELQKIRDASKTGGALGNVSNKDVSLLESAVASLDQKQSPQQLKQNLKEVIDLYTKIQQDAGIKIGQVPTTQAAPAAAPSVSTSGWSIIK